MRDYPSLPLYSLLITLRDYISIALYLLNLLRPHSSVPDPDEPTTARDKFGGQKGISSDMFFGRGSYDPAATAEAQQRLQSFQGATSISSAQYFGRDEEEEAMMRSGSGEGLLGGGEGLERLESVAKDAIQRVLSNPDVQNVGESIRTGALKVCLSPPSSNIFR